MVIHNSQYSLLFKYKIYPVFIKYIPYHKYLINTFEETLQKMCVNAHFLWMLEHRSVLITFHFFEEGIFMTSLITKQQKWPVLFLLTLLTLHRATLSNMPYCNYRTSALTGQIICIIFKDYKTRHRGWTSSGLHIYWAPTARLALARSTPTVPSLRWSHSVNTAFSRPAKKTQNVRTPAFQAAGIFFFLCFSLVGRGELHPPQFLWGQHPPRPQSVPPCCLLTKDTEASTAAPPHYRADPPLRLWDSSIHPHHSTL